MAVQFNLVFCSFDREPGGVDQADPPAPIFEQKHLQLCESFTSLSRSSRLSIEVPALTGSGRLGGRPGRTTAKIGGRSEGCLPEVLTFPSTGNGFFQPKSVRRNHQCQPIPV